MRLEHALKQLGAGLRQRVEDHFALTARGGEALLAERPEVMGDEILRASTDPSEIADAELAAVTKRGSQAQARRICKRPRTGCGDLHRFCAQAPAAQLLGQRNVETENVAVVVSHAYILTNVDACLPDRSLDQGLGRTHAGKLFAISFLIFVERAHGKSGRPPRVEATDDVCGVRAAQLAQTRCGEAR